MPNPNRVSFPRAHSGARPARLPTTPPARLLQRVRSGTTRREILDALRNPPGASRKRSGISRTAMRVAHLSDGCGTASALQRLVETLDRRCQAEGFHVLQSWDFQAHRFADDIAPVLLLEYCARAGGPRQPTSARRSPSSWTHISCRSCHSSRCARGTRATPTPTSTA